MSEDAKMILCFPSLWGFEFTFWMLEKHIHRTDAAILFVAIMSPIIFVTILPLMFLQVIEESLLQVIVSHDFLSRGVHIQQTVPCCYLYLCPSVHRLNKSLSDPPAAKQKQCEQSEREHHSPLNCRSK